MKNSLLWILFAVFGLAYLLLMHSALPLSMRVALKLLPIFTLALIAFQSRTAPKFLFVALAFSAGGDFLLALPLAHGFVLGLASFLVAQLTYTTGFFRARAKPLSTFARLGVLATLAYGLVLGALLLPQTGAMLIPVTVYLLAISAMACAAALHRSQALILFAGALIFIASDSMIAIDRFLAPFDGARHAIMLTYYIAQGTITWGVLRAANDAHQA